MAKDYSELTDETVTENYEEIITDRLASLQIFPQMFQDENITETFKLKKCQRNKNIKDSELVLKDG
jgi:hypothetical protein